MKPDLLGIYVGTIATFRVIVGYHVDQLNELQTGFALGVIAVVVFATKFFPIAVVLGYIINWTIAGTTDHTWVDPAEFATATFIAMLAGAGIFIYIMLRYSFLMLPTILLLGAALVLDGLNELGVPPEQAIGYLQQGSA